VTIQRVGAEHAAVLAAIQAASLAAAKPRGSGGEAWAAAGFHAQLSMHGVVALLDPRGGFALLRVAADEAEILAVAVIPTVQRRGVARALLQEGLRQTAELGAREVFLEVAFGNAPALALYHSLGFNAVGRRRGYYADGQDAHVLRATLTVASNA
jgi:ribosomal-protein-alanine N-acetyltransferase